MYDHNMRIYRCFYLNVLAYGGWGDESCSKKGSFSKFGMILRNSANPEFRTRDRGNVNTRGGEEERQRNRMGDSSHF